tara:strand:- start:171 stop:740 length:570 start_codon:yes stop_codon:yes gene_type:complete
MCDKKYEGYIYMITNNINGKYYIGSHCGSDPKYMGSGKALKFAYAKHGIDNFTKWVLYYCNHYREEEERILKDLDAAGNPMMYNMKNVALGIEKGTKLSDQTKQRMSARKTGKQNPQFGMTGEKSTCFGRTGSKHPMFGKTHTPETLEKLSKLSKGRKKPTTCCPHCSRHIANHVYTRFHGDNCKQKVQ